MINFYLKVGDMKLSPEKKSEAIDTVAPKARAGNGIPKLPDTMPIDKGLARNRDNVQIEKGDVVLLTAAVIGFFGRKDQGQNNGVILEVIGADGVRAETVMGFTRSIFAKLNKEQAAMFGIELKDDDNE